MKNNFKKAFSLIEIAIVILVVGILIVGISKGVDLVYDMRLATARALTDKAPMVGMENLEMWLETTSENSLATGTTSFTNVKNPNDKQAIGRWNDINTAFINPNYKNHAEQATLSYQPLYIKDGINGLPALLFDGIDDYIASTTRFIINNFTVFAVGYPQASCTTDAGQYSGISGKKYIIYPQQGDVIFANNNAAGSGIALCTNFIAGFTHYNSFMDYNVNNIATISKPIQFTLKYSSRTPKLYINSANSYSATASLKNVFLGLSFGGGRKTGFGENYGYFKGFIGELIFFSTDLNDNDRKLIESYLIEKWRIKL